MIGSATDKKSIELVKQLARLRNHIDIQRIIGLNVPAIRESALSEALVGYIQVTALESLAMQIAKIYERNKEFELNSIPGVLDSLQEFDANPNQLAAIAVFGAKYENDENPESAHSHLRNTYRRFTNKHKRSFEMLRHFRNKFGAHSEHNAERKDLPSQFDFEVLFEFAYEFYHLVASSIVGVGPAEIPGKAGAGLIRLLGAAGLHNLRRDFEPDE